MAVQKSDLRYGNKLTVAHESNSPIVTVAQIKNRGVVVVEDNQYFPFEDLSPVDLTPELLEKCGFNLQPQRQSIYFKDRLKIWMGHTGVLCYLKHEDNDSSYYIPNAGIKSLHQLQNLYEALTGKELPITL